MITFSRPDEMLTWVLSDRETLTMSHMIFDSVMYCLDNSLDGVIAITLVVEHRDENDNVTATSGIDIEVVRPNFEHIIKLYAKRLIEREDYERVGAIIPQLQKHGFEIS